MTTFVLVHGGWVGAWCWSRVAKSLTARQHEVVAPTLTGLGERSHLLNPEIDLETHILDVVNRMKWQELRDVVLVGHSYGGMVVSGVAEWMEKSIASIVMLDAFFPADGQSLVDLQPAPCGRLSPRRLGMAPRHCRRGQRRRSMSTKMTGHGLTPRPRRTRSNAFCSPQNWPAPATGSPSEPTSVRPISPACHSMPECRKHARKNGA
jgi:pimeloyl-ACP methyl ester carboxylesterase